MIKILLGLLVLAFALGLLAFIAHVDTKYPKVKEYLQIGFWSVVVISFVGLICYGIGDSILNYDKYFK